MTDTIQLEQLRILEIAIEDYCGLWEILPEIQDLLPHLTEEKLHDTALVILETMIEGGLVYLVRYDEVDNISEALELVEVKNALAVPQNWTPPNSIDETHIRFTATEKGEKFYFNQRFTR